MHRSVSTMARAAGPSVPPAAPPGTLPPVVLALTLCAATLAGGCAAPSPPERPAYEIADRVGDVDPARLVGLWRVIPLNPYPGQATRQTTIEYRADGSVVGTIPSPERDRPTAGGGDLELSGRWTVVDGTVRHEHMRVRALSDDPMAHLMSRMLNTQERELGGRADIRELDADTVVMLGTDGAAVRYERVSAR